MIRTFSSEKSREKTFNKSTVKFIGSNIKYDFVELTNNI